MSRLSALAAAVLLSSCGTTSGTASPAPSPSGSAARAAMATRLRAEVDQAVAAIVPAPILAPLHTAEDPCRTEQGGVGREVYVGRGLAVSASGAASLQQMQLALERLGWTFAITSTVTESVVERVSTIVTGTTSWGASATLRAQEVAEPVAGTPQRATLTIRVTSPCVMGDA